ncbi:RICIN domain-containing protein [Microbispora rosea]|uniref:RICIN domain-containing protein n=1 Tax=Microbispora rosea TaxID=58117 RepID=UPI0037C76C1C
MSRSVRLIGIGPDGENFTWDIPRSPRSSPALLVMFLYENNDRNGAVVAVRLLAVLALVGSMLSVSSTAAHASTGQLRGVNWADARDNFVNGVLYVSGLGSSDTYFSAAATANQVVGPAVLDHRCQHRPDTDQRADRGELLGDLHRGDRHRARQGQRDLRVLGLQRRQTVRHDRQRVIQYTCGGGANQQWTRTPS